MTANRLKQRLAALASGLSLLAMTGLAYAAPQMEKGLGLPRDASKDGHRIDWLIQSTSVFVVLLFVIMCVWMLLACIKHNRHHKAEYDHGDSKHHITVALTLSAIIFFVVDGNLYYHSMRDLGQAFWNFAHAEGRPEALRLEVNAHQWAWDARYAGTDGKFNTADDVLALNDIRVPVDAPVIIELASVDVIHSLYLPNFRTKQDAVPGTINSFWFQAKDVGDYDIACAQHCGPHHYKMKGQLMVMPRAEFDAWLKEASAQAARSYDPTDTEAHWGWEWRGRE
jgi:cytochrome c oxidase subunit 2